MKSKSSNIKKRSVVFSFIVSSSMMMSSQAFADRAAYGTATLTPTQVVVPTSAGANSAAAPQAETIKTEASKNVQKTKTAKTTATIVGLACGYKAFAACSPAGIASGGGWRCAAYIACVGASVKINNDLGKVTDTGGMTVGAVNFDDTNPGHAADSTVPNPNANNNSNFGPQADVNLAKLKNVQKDLEKKGWKFDDKTGAVTTPEGKILTGDMMTIPPGQSSNSLGMSHADLNKFNNEMKDLKAKVEEQAKGADAAGDSFADTPAGGSSSSMPTSMTNPMDMPGSHSLAPNGLGLDRNPAQVAGMSKSFNGEVIGVAKDSLFDMVDRRYELLKNDNKFLAP